MARGMEGLRNGSRFSTIDFSWQRPRNPSGPANRPKPELLKPPKGNDWLKYVVPSTSLTLVMPASRRAHIFAARDWSAECAHELSAKEQLFARRTASLSPH